MGRIAVVGAGIVGCSCALFLQRDGHDVVLVDPREPGAGTSKGNAGIISCSAITPLATIETLRGVPAMLRDPMGALSIRWRHLPELLPWLVRFCIASRSRTVESSTVALAALLQHANQAHDIVIQQAGLGDLVRGGGWLKVAYDRKRLDRYMASIRRYYDRFGVVYHMLDREGCLDLEPALNPEIAAGVLIADCRAVRHPQDYTGGIARAVMERGAEHVRQTVRDIERADGVVKTVITDAGKLAVDGVVLAAGAFSGALARMSGAPVPLIAERGYHLMLPHPAVTLNNPVYTVEGSFVVAPMTHGLRLTGGVELASNAAPPDYARIRRLIEPARRLVPGLTATVDDAWQGHRPSLPDSLPVVDRAPALRNFWYAFGHQHIGLTLGPLTGRLVADLVAGRQPLVDLAPFRARRAFC
ncbi:D-amino-acid dehydrogenase [Arboricoccus pini]|uniref:D-amino-acid dehydrogenase n=1 Tax=Arboricoccus pini TaxID=1963835 RepID=A0A212R6N0_9PROT|nr:FAD-binding oxidoreductase [Arboricoccus pini]SNB67846.1 D-amino-acid dehydrogenase [Arboricoccus pini]